MAVARTAAEACSSRHQTFPTTCPLFPTTIAAANCITMARILTVVGTTVATAADIIELAAHNRIEVAHTATEPDILTGLVAHTATATAARITVEAAHTLANRIATVAVAADIELVAPARIITTTTTKAGSLADDILILVIVITMARLVHLAEAFRSLTAVVVGLVAGSFAPGSRSYCGLLAKKF